MDVRKLITDYITQHIVFWPTLKPEHIPYVVTALMARTDLDWSDHAGGFASYTVHEGVPKVIADPKLASLFGVTVDKPAAVVTADTDPFYGLPQDVYKAMPPERRLALWERRQWEQRQAAPKAKPRPVPEGFQDWEPSKRLQWANEQNAADLAAERHVKATSENG